MSSATNRGKARVAFDFYPSPPWTVHRLLDRHGSEILYDGARVLEPTVGDGAIVRAVREWRPDRGLVPSYADSLNWTGVELRRDALDPETVLQAHFEGQDFRAWRTPDCRFDLALGNPPFGIAEAIIRRALEVSIAVAMLLRVDFLGSADRVDFWEGPAADPYLRVLPERPSFDGHGTDSSTYAWFIWGADLTGPTVDVLDSTPASVRAAQKPRPPTGIPQLGFDLEGETHGTKTGRDPRN